MNFNDVAHPPVSTVSRGSAGRVLAPAGLGRQPGDRWPMAAGPSQATEARGPGGEGDDAGLLLGGGWSGRVRRRADGAGVGDRRARFAAGGGQGAEAVVHPPLRSGHPERAG